MQPFLAKLTHIFLEELVGPAALMLSMYPVSCGIKDMGRGSDGYDWGPPLATVLQRGVLTGEHVTLYNKGKAIDMRTTYA